MTDRVFTGIKKITVNSVDETNVLDVDIWAITDEGDEDLIDILFTPNTIEGIGAKQWAKGWLLKFVHDGWTDVWDSYIDDDGEGAVIPTLVVTFNTIVAGVAGTEIWTFQASKSYVSNRDEVGMRIEEKHTPGAIYVLIIGTVAVTHT